MAPGAGVEPAAPGHPEGSAAEPGELSYRLLDDGRDDRRPRVGLAGREHDGRLDERHDRDELSEPWTGASFVTVVMFVVPIVVFLFDFDPGTGGGI